MQLLGRKMMLVESFGEVCVLCRSEEKESVEGRTSGEETGPGATRWSCLNFLFSYPQRLTATEMVLFGTLFAILYLTIGNRLFYFQINTIHRYKKSEVK